MRTNPIRMPIVKSLRISLGVVAIGVLMAGAARAELKTWGDWYPGDYYSDNASKWNDGTVPVNGDNLYYRLQTIPNTSDLSGNHDTNITFRAPTGSNLEYGGMEFFHEGFGTATFIQNDNSLRLRQLGILGGKDNAFEGASIYRLTDGELRVNETTFIGQGAVSENSQFQLEGGRFQSQIVSVGSSATGSLHQSGGTLSAGNFSVGDEINGNGVLTMTGGTANIDFFAISGYGTGRAEILGGELTINNDTRVGVSNIGRMTIGGSARINPAKAVQDASTLFVGYLDSRADSSKVTQEGSSSVNLYHLNVGHSARGLYEINGGTLNVGEIVVGHYGMGDFGQNGGTVNIVRVPGKPLSGLDGRLRIGAIGEMGSYRMNGGHLYTVETIVGNGNAGSFRQTDGIHVIDDELRIGADSTYDLLGGRLSVPDTAIDPTGTLNVSGGMLVGDSMLNLGRIEQSNGTFEIANLRNSGDIKLENGVANLTGQVVNDIGGVITLSGRTEIVGAVENHGTVRVIETLVDFSGGYREFGLFDSRMGRFRFADFSAGSTGYILSRDGDEFSVQGDFVSSSTQNTGWDTSMASLVFESNPAQMGLADLLHTFQVGGVDMGTSRAGYVDNFSWGSVELESGHALNLSGLAGSALYVGEFLGLEMDLSNLTGSGFNIYYDSLLDGNAYLGGMEHEFGDNSWLLPIANPASVPAPATFALFGIGLVGIGLGRKRLNSTQTRPHNTDPASVDYSCVTAVRS